MASLTAHIVRCALVLAWSNLVIVILSVARKPTHRTSSNIEETSLPSCEVVIPAYNEEESIATAVKGWQAAAPPSCRILVVDDGSNDLTAAVVQEVMVELPNIWLVRLPRMGKARALNEALKYVTADTVVVADADTVPGPSVFASLLGPMRDPQVLAVSGRRVLDRSHRLYSLLDIEHSLGSNLIRNLGNHWKSQLTASGSISAFRTEGLKKTGGWPVGVIAEDTAVTIALQSHGRVIFQWEATAYVTLAVHPHDVLEQHRRWLTGVCQAIVRHFTNTGALPKRALPCTAYFLVYGLLKGLIDPAADAASIWSVLTAQRQRRSILIWLLIVGPNAVAGAIAVRMDGHPARTFLLVPPTQLLVKLYSIVLGTYMTIRVIQRRPFEWIHR